MILDANESKALKQVEKNQIDERQRKEKQFLSSLNSLYQDIVNDEGDYLQIRQRCNQGILEAFSHVGYKIKGLENLPINSGHIFILNHHKIDPLYTLTNQFQISLDTNLITAILAQHYPNASTTRVVREGRKDELAHFQFYSKFNFISVKTAESDGFNLNKDAKAEASKTFFNHAQMELEKGNNIMLCPEGTSNACADSPSTFKPGAFLLAAKTKPEPLIVPIAIVDFDKHYATHTPTILIKPAFRLSERLDEVNRESLSTFLKHYRDEFRGYIEEARAIKKDGDHP